jgi:hypothetical protein
MRSLLAYFLLLTMTTSVVVSAWKQWQALDCYEWAEDGKEKSNSEKEAEKESDKESDKEWFSPRRSDGHATALKDWIQKEARQMMTQDIACLLSQCHGALPDMPPEAGIPV